MVEPLQRNDTSAQIGASKAPCGGFAKGMSKLLASPGTSTLVQWRVIVPSENGTCKIRLSTGKLLGQTRLGIDDEQHFMTLFPQDRSADSSGKFECGRHAGAHETKTVSLPADISCEKCTLQLIWTTPSGAYYSCSDVTLMSEKIKQCIGKCHNDGVCVNGVCVCNEPYFGTYCEQTRNHSSLLYSST